MEKKNLSINENIKNLDSGRVIKLGITPLVKEEDINALFMGLVKLIKRNSAYECEKRYKGVIESLRREINFLKLENKILKEKSQGDIVSK